MSGKKTIQKVALIAVAGTLASCGPPPPPPPAPPPPPPPVVEAFPARPIAPGYAQDNLVIPAKNELGVRETVNSDLTPEQMIWNLRSAYNVAALNCHGPDYAALGERYGAFLKANARELTATNSKVDSQFREKFGRSKYKGVRDSYTTQVYNYFSLPPALTRFCAAALNTSNALAEAPKGKLEETAAIELPKLERVFLGYFNDYEDYRQKAAAWDAEYLATYGKPYRHRWMVPKPTDPNAPPEAEAETFGNAFPDTATTQAGKAPVVVAGDNPLSDEASATGQP